MSAEIYTLDKAAFQRSPAGRLVPTLNGQFGFVPNPLPPVISSDAILNGLVNATQAWAN
jgi:hypothetical protein